jgi:hypothetical protein
MNNKKIVTLLALMFLSPLASVSIAKAETQLVWSSPDEWEGIDVEIYAPYQAYPGDNITMRVKVGATKNLNDTYVTVGIDGSKSEGHDTWTTYVYVLSDEDLLIGKDRDQNFTLNIPSDVSPGSIYGHIYCEWRTYSVPVPKSYSEEDSFEVTYLKSKELGQLKVDYEELNASYWELNSNYTELNSTYTELEEKFSARSGALSGTRNLMYAFIATTAVSAATAIFLFIRRPKERWE